MFGIYFPFSVSAQPLPTMRVRNMVANVFILICRCIRVSPARDARLWHSVCPLPTRLFPNVKADPTAGIEDYSELSKLVLGFVGQMNGNQPGDPQQAVKIMIDVVKSEGVWEGKEIPERLPLGPDVLEKIRGKYTKYLDFCKEHETLITSTDLVGPEKGNMRTVVNGD
jgi:hypothetical protein